VVNLALPYQDLTIMDACLAAGVNYLDTANYEPKDEAKFEYHWQWAYQDRFKEAGLMALLGSGFRSGRDQRVRHVAQEAQAENHPHARHSRLQRRRSRPGLCHQLQPGNQHPRSDRSGAPLGERRVGRKPGDVRKKKFDFEAVGPKNMYLMYHEELESLASSSPRWSASASG
jgi:saccharopine dehydrogenase (NAD+, L-lysine-forming)